MTLTPLEDAVIKMLLAGEGPTLEQLRRQFEVATVTTRENTGVGFYTEFTVPAELRLTFRELQLEGVRADIAGLVHGAGFILWVANGVLDCLEGYSYDETWPADDAAFTLTYTDAVRGGLQR